MGGLEDRLNMENSKTEDKKFEMDIKKLGEIVVPFVCGVVGGLPIFLLGQSRGNNG